MNLELLKEKMLEQKFNEDYIDLCVNYASNLKKQELPIIFDINHFAKLLGKNSRDIFKIASLKNCYYKKINILKKNGEIRELNSPCDELKEIQNWILKELLYKINTHHSSMGFTPELSILNNALPHTNKECIINLDLSNFFPSIPSKRIYYFFKSLGYSTHITSLLTNLCTYKNGLPQGAPTSPYLSNLICLHLDKRLKGLSLKINANYTRYADDITFSGTKEITNFIPLIEKIISQENFKLNLNKKRVLFQYHQQMVTGLIVNNYPPSVPKKKLRYLEQQIYFCKTRGVFNNLEYQGLDVSNYKEHLYGLVFFIKMVNPEKSMKYLSDLNEIDWES